jgi:predicted nucleotidyltransferase
VNVLDPNIQRIEVVAHAQGDLRDRLVLVGGCAVSLLLDSVTAPPARVTYDVDLIAEVVAIGEYHALERAFAQQGFVRDQSPDAPICRWKINAVTVDLMPTGDAVLGFSNRWYPEAIRAARSCPLPSGGAIRLISAPAFLATKFEAFDTRGAGDLMASHDFEDIVNVLEGRSTLLAEIDATAAPLRTFLIERFAELQGRDAFSDALPGLLTPDELHSQRTAMVLSRVGQIAKL